MAVAKSSPMSDTLEFCLKYVDSQNAEELVNKIVEVIKVGVGLPTKVGTAKFVSSLTYRRAAFLEHSDPLRSKSDEIKPFAGKLVNAMMNPLKERSTSVRKAFAGAMANVAKYSTA